MASVSKSRRKANPNATRNGRVRLRALSLTKLQEMLPKASTPRQKDKIQRFILKIEKYNRKKGLQSSQEPATI